MRFTSISVDKFEYDDYTNIVVRATKNNDSARAIAIASEFGVIGSNTILGFYFETGDGYYKQDATTFSSNLPSNAKGSYTGIFSGSIVEENNGSIIVITDGSISIKY